MLYGILATGIRAGANILLLPLVLKVLTPSELALWWVFLSLGMVATFADFGFGPVITRIYSYFWAGAQDFDIEGLRPPPEKGSPNLAGIRRFDTAIRTLYLRVSLIGMGLLALVGTGFIVRPAAQFDNPIMIWLCWGAFILAMGQSLAATQWTIACQGINRVREVQRANLIGGLVYLAIATGLLLAGAGLFAMVISTAVRTFVTLRMCRSAYLEVVGTGTKESIGDLREVLRKIWPNARKFGAITIAVFMVYHANVLICSHFLGSATTASYGLTTQFGNVIATFSGLWLMVKWPELTILRTQGRLQHMAIIFAQRLTLTMLSFIAMALVLAVFGNKVLAWKDTHTRFLDTPYLIVYLFHVGQQQFYAQFGSLAFTENVVPFVKLSLWTGVVLIALSVVLVQYLGLWGLLLAPILSTIPASTWYITRRGFQGQPLTVRQFARAALFRPV